MATVDLCKMVAEQVEKTPDVVAVIYDGEEERCSVKLTYREMWKRASKICEELKSHGAENVLVGVCTESGINLPSLLFGILQASSTFFPFGFDGSGFLHQSIQKLGVKYVLLDSSSFESLQPKLLELHARIAPCCEDLQSLGLFLVRVSVPSGGEEPVKHIPGLAYCISTSGTTGSPKLVRVPHACIGPNIMDFKKEFQSTVGDVTFMTSPLTFDPSMIDIFMTLASGATLLLVAPIVKMSAYRLLNVLSRRYRVSILQITPSLFGRFDPEAVKSTLLGADSPLRVLAFGGETFPDRSIFDACLHPDNKTYIYNVYGITELSCWATLLCVRHPRGTIQEPISIGKALTGTQVKVVNEQGETLTSGTGHIWIGGSTRTCLLNEETEDVLCSGGVWRKTGDLGLIDSDGNIFCHGRNDRQIKRHGKRLDLDCLEKISKCVSGVKDCQAVHRAKKLTLFLKCEVETEAKKRRMCTDVKSHLLYTLPSQYQPDAVAVFQDFPVTTHGKLDVAALLALADTTPEQCNNLTALTVESYAYRLWQEVTGHKVSPSCPEVQFLSCGGDSLKAVQLLESVENYLGQNVPDLWDTLLTGTLGDFLTLIKQHCKETGTKQPCRDSKVRNEGTTGDRDHSKSEDMGASLLPSAALPSSLLKHAADSKGQLTETVDSTVCYAVDEHSVSLSEGTTDLKHKNLAESEQMSGPPAKWRKVSQHPPESVEICSASVHPTSDFKACSCSHCGGRSESSKVTSVLQTRSLLKGEACEVATQNICHENKVSKVLMEQESCDRIDQSVLEDSATNNSVSNNDTDFAGETAFVSSVSRANTSVITTNHNRAHPSYRCTCSLHSSASEAVSSAPQPNGFGSRSLSDRGDSDEARLEMELQWSVNTGKCVDASPLVAETRCGGKVLFIGSHSHLFFAISMECGKILWFTKLGDRVEGSACLSPCGSWVVVGCYDSKMYSLRADSGEVDWQVTTGDMVKCTPVCDPASHLVFCGSHDGFLYALHCRERTVAWKTWMGGGGVFASPVVNSSNSEVCGATLRGHVTAVSVMTGTRLWTVSLGKPVFSSPSVHAGQLYVGCVDSDLYCLSCTTGKQVWACKTGAPIFSSPVVTKEDAVPHILFGSHDNHLYCLTETGQLVWRHETTSTVYAAPFVFQVCSESTDKHGRSAHLLSYCKGNADLNGTNYAKESFSEESCPHVKGISSSDSTSGQPSETSRKLVVCASTKGKISILCCATGKCLGTVTLPGELFSSPVIVGDRLVIGCRDDNVYCCKLSLHGNFWK